MALSPVFGAAATNSSIAVLNLVTGVVVARLLGPAGRGELAAIQTLPTLIAAVAMLGQTDALVYFSAKGGQGSRTLVLPAVTIAFTGALVLSGVFLAVAPIVLDAQSTSVVSLARIYILIAPLFALAWLPFHIFRGLGHFRAWNLFRLLPVAGWLLIVLGCFVGGHGSVKVLSLSYLAMTGLIGILIWWRLLRVTSGSFRFDSTMARRMLLFGAPAVGGTLPQMLNLRMDQVFLAALLDAKQLGYYVVAVGWSGAVLPAVTALGLVLFPKVAAAAKCERLELVAEASRISLLLAIAGGMTAAVLSPLAIPFLFGREFAAAIPLAMSLCIGTVFLAWSFVLEEGLRGLGRTPSVMLSQVTALAVTAVILAALIPLIGSAGAVVASIAGGAVCAGLDVWALQKAGIRVSRLIVPRREDGDRWIRLLEGIATKIKKRQIGGSNCKDNGRES